MGFAMVGAVFAFLSVAFGAFGAHVLAGQLSTQMLGVYNTGAQYEMYHALALLVVGIFLRLDVGGRSMRAAGWLFAIGSLLFSGSLYALSMTGATVLGALTPIGGLLLLSGWVLFAMAIAKSARPR